MFQISQIQHLFPQPVMSADSDVVVTWWWTLRRLLPHIVASLSQWFKVLSSFVTAGQLTAGHSLIYVLKWIVDKSAAGQMNGKGVTTAVSTYDSISTLIIHFDLWAKLWSLSVKWVGLGWALVRCCCFNRSSLTLLFHFPQKNLQPSIQSDNQPSLYRGNDFTVRSHSEEVWK